MVLKVLEQALPPISEKESSTESRYTDLRENGAGEKHSRCEDSGSV
jgi:hypothetical protein